MPNPQHLPQFTTCNPLHLKTQGCGLIIPKHLPGHCYLILLGKSQNLMVCLSYQSIKRQSHTNTLNMALMTLKTNIMAFTVQFNHVQKLN